MDKAYPLAGVRVLDLTRLLPGGFCTLLLADLGADVVKVEDPGAGDYSRTMPPLVTMDDRRCTMDGQTTTDRPPSVADGSSSIVHRLSSSVGAVYAALNRGKRSVVIDLKTEAGRSAFLRLVEQADVVVEGFRPGVMDRLGVGARTLLAMNPRLVYCALTGYGQTGPLAQTVGHDINYIGTVGLLDLIGAPDGPPIVPGAQLADLSGAMVAGLGILAALVRRATTGAGGMVDVSMAEAALALLSLPWAEWVGSGENPGRGAHKLNGGWACYHIYEAGDGRYLALGALEPKFWTAFCQAVGRPEWGGQQFETAVQPGLKAEVALLLAGRPAAEWLALVEGQDIPLTLVNTLAELPTEPQLAARGVFLATAFGLAARTPVRLDDLPPAATSQPPAQGEQSVVEVLAGWANRAARGP